LLHGLKCGRFWRKTHGLLSRICIPMILARIFHWFLGSAFDLCCGIALKLQLIFRLDYLLMRVGYWIHTVLLCLDLSTYLCPVMFVLLNWVQWHLVYIYLQLLYLLGRLFHLLICRELSLFWLILAWWLLCQIWV
jgi:hypothetical protein